MIMSECYNQQNLYNYNLVSLAEKMLYIKFEKNSPCIFQEVKNAQSVIHGGRTTEDGGREPIAIGLLSGSADLK